ncbi:hypothetical protein [Bacillus tropicus]|uniref:hypothetical protein n=1 Tax=Bacillus tropicus TaxID=2026188 RepID=UPI0013D6712E|nr:hypothetical protein [Bacillus tropicus]
MKEAFKELIIKPSLFLILVFSADHLFKESEVETNLLNKLMCWDLFLFIHKFNNSTF